MLTWLLPLPIIFSVFFFPSSTSFFPFFPPRMSRVRDSACVSNTLSVSEWWARSTHTPNQLSDASASWVETRKKRERRVGRILWESEESDFTQESRRRSDFFLQKREKKSQGITVRGSSGLWELCVSQAKGRVSLSVLSKFSSVSDNKKRVGFQSTLGKSYYMLRGGRRNVSMIMKSE